MNFVVEVSSIQRSIPTMIKQYPMTKAGKEKLEKELTYLKEERRKELAEDINEARRFCDFSEDVSFRDMLSGRAALEEQIKSLEDKLHNATLLPEEQTSSTVTLGSSVTIIEFPSGEKETYTIVGTTEADPFENKLSSESPIAKSLLTHEKNDEVVIQTPGGNRKVKIINVH